MTDETAPSPGWHATTILMVRKGGTVVIGGDGQVSMGQTVVKANARKVRRLAKGDVIAGFAGASVVPGASGLRTMMMSSISRAMSPPTMRSMELVLMASLLTRVMTWVAEVAWPSAVLPWALTTHWLSVARVQEPSPRLPSASPTAARP